MRTLERTVWVCENCNRSNSTSRKRCTDCGTTRH